MFTLTKSPPPIPRVKRRRHACDDRCIYARGPDCNCKCGGLNHGAGWQDDATLDLFTTTEDTDK